MPYPSASGGSFGIPRLARLFKREQTDLLFLINHRNTLFYGIPRPACGVPAILNWENETFKRYSFNALTVLNHRLFHLGEDGVVAAARGMLNMSRRLNEFRHGRCG